MGAKLVILQVTAQFVMLDLFYSQIIAAMFQHHYCKIKTVKILAIPDTIR